MSRTYNAFDLDKPVLKLGKHGDFTLGDITEPRQIDLAKAAELLQAIDTEDVGQLGKFVDAICELIEAACEEPGAGAIVRKAWDAGEIGAKVLGGCAQFVNEWLIEESSAGNALSPSTPES